MQDDLGITEKEDLNYVEIEDLLNLQVPADDAENFISLKPF